MKGRNLLWNIIYAFSIFGALCGGLFLFQIGQNPKPQQKTTDAVVNNIPTITFAPIATPVPPKEIDLSQYKITILNGSGKKGEAAKAKDLLEKDKFHVVSIGNADNPNFKETIIKAKKEIPVVFLEQLEKTLSSLYLVKDSVEDLGAGNPDVSIIIGGEKNP